MTRTFGRDHHHIDKIRRDDLFVVDIEAVGETQGHARTQMIPDTAFIDGTHFFIVDQHHHPVGFFDRIGGIQNLETIRFGDRGTFGVFIKSDHYIHAAFPQILGVGVTLAAVTDHGHGQMVEEFPVAVAVIVHFAHFLFPLC